MRPNVLMFVAETHSNRILMVKCLYIEALAPYMDLLDSISRVRGTAVFYVSLDENPRCIRIHNRY